jgi:hypothetical protein
MEQLDYNLFWFWGRRLQAHALIDGAMTADRSYHLCVPFPPWVMRTKNVDNIPGLGTVLECGVCHCDSRIGSIRVSGFRTGARIRLDPLCRPPNSLLVHAAQIHTNSAAACAPHSRTMFAGTGVHLAGSERDSVLFIHARIRRQCVFGGDPSASRNRMVYSGCRRRGCVLDNCRTGALVGEANLAGLAEFFRSLLVLLCYKVESLD